MTAGRLAGETAIEAHRQGNFSGAFLKTYRRKLEDSFVLKDLRQYRRMTDFLDQAPHFMGTYVNYLNGAALKYFNSHGIPKRDMEKQIFDLLWKRRSIFSVARTSWAFAPGCEADMRRKPEEPLPDEVRATLPRVNVDDLLRTVKVYVDADSAHISVLDPKVCDRCAKRPCLTFCPVSVYTLDREGKVMVGYQACVECGSCRIGCPFGNIRWDLPRGGYGVAYKFG